MSLRSVIGGSTGGTPGAVTSVAGRTGDVIVNKSDVGLSNVPNYGMATQAEAEAGAIATAFMSPLQAKQAITFQVPALPLLNATPGVATASKAVILDANKDLATVRRLTVNNINWPSSGANITFAGANDVTNSKIWQHTYSLFGTVTAATNGYASPNHIYISGDSVDASSITNGLFGFFVQHAVSAGHKGMRSALTGNINVNGTSGSGAAANYDYVGTMAGARITAGQGGTVSVDPATYIGGIFAGNSIVFSNAPALAGVMSHEFDISLAAGGSAARKIGILISNNLDDAVKGTFSDAAIQIAGRSATDCSWTHGIEFGSQVAKSPFDANSTFIGASSRLYGVPGVPIAPVAKYGVDFNQVAGAAGGAAFRSPGFSVDWSGKISGTVTAATGGSDTLANWLSDLDVASGIATASRALVLDANKDISTVRRLGVNNINWPNVSGSGNITFAGANDISNSKIWQHTYSLLGTVTGAPNGFASPNHIYISGDNVDASSLSNGLAGFFVQHAISAGHKGMRSAIQGQINVNGTPAGGANYDYVPVTSICRGNANLGGTSTADPEFMIGGLFGGNSYVFASFACTYLAGVIGHEVDISMQAGSSAARRIGVLISNNIDDAVRGIYTDAALQIAGRSNHSWKYGIEFGSEVAVCPFDINSTLIKIQPQLYGTETPGVQSTIYRGVDLSECAISNAAYLSPGFSVDGDGDLAARTIKAIPGLAASGVSNSPGSTVSNNLTGATAWRDVRVIQAFYLTPATGAMVITAPWSANGVYQVRIRGFAFNWGTIDAVLTFNRQNSTTFAGVTSITHLGTYKPLIRVARNGTAENVIIIGGGNTQWSSVVGLAVDAFIGGAGGVDAAITGWTLITGVSDATITSSYTFISNTFTQNTHQRIGIGQIGSTDFAKWQANGNGTNISAMGADAPTAYGTATARNVVVGNATGRRRIGYVPASAAANLATGWSSPAAQWFRNASSNPASGGFYYTAKFFLPAYALGNRAFAGMSTTAQVTAVDPSTLNNTIGVGFDSSDVNWQFYSRDAAGVGSKLDTSIPIVANEVVEVIIESPPGLSNPSVIFRNISTGANFTAALGSTGIPGVNTLMFACCQGGTGTNTVTTNGQIDISSMTVETN